MRASRKREYLFPDMLIIINPNTMHVLGLREKQDWY